MRGRLCHHRNGPWHRPGPLSSRPVRHHLHPLVRLSRLRRSGNAASSDRRTSESSPVSAAASGPTSGPIPTWVRIAWIVITLLTSVLPMVLIYILLAAVLPTAPSVRAAAEEPAQTAQAPMPIGRGSRPDWSIAFGVLLLAVGAMLLLAQFVPLRWDLIWPLSLIALGIAFLVVASRRRSSGPR